jgi:hypothetical protein
MSKTTAGLLVATPLAFSMLAWFSWSCYQRWQATWIAIASVEQLHFAELDKMEAALAGSGIDYHWESAGYIVVSVRRRDIGNAIDLLRDDATAKGYLIWLRGEPRPWSASERTNGQDEEGASIWEW